MFYKATNSYGRFEAQESDVYSAGAFRSGVAAASHSPFRRHPDSLAGAVQIGGSVARRLGPALFFSAAALVLTLLLGRFFPYPFLLLFFAGVMASAWFGGTSSGLLAVFLSTLAVDYFFLPPFHSLVIKGTDVAYFIAFVACASVAGWVSTFKRKGEEALREARDLLEVRVAERTADLRRSNTELQRRMDEHEVAQQTLRKTQAELAHLSRVLTIGELTTSIAHEISQPLTAVVTHAHACLEWLSSDPPTVPRARQTVERIIQDGTRAGAVLGRIRAMFKKDIPTRDLLDVNEIMHELTILLRDEAIRRNIVLRTQFSSGLPKIKGDRVQLQQVVLNLILNGMDAMAEIAADSRELFLSSRLENVKDVVVSVQDCGVGLSPAIAEKIFEPFFTTKPEGIGMGLSISRSIIESHDGRLWATPLPFGGTIFQFAIPACQQHSDE